jgi:hypothetical protein
MLDFFKQKGLKKIVTVNFEVTIKKDKKAGLLSGRTFKGNIKYDSAKLDGKPGGQGLSLSEVQGSTKGMHSVTFDFIDIKSGFGMRRYTEKDEANNYVFPSLIFNSGRLDALYFTVGDFYMQLVPTEYPSPEPKSKNKAGFGFIGVGYTTYFAFFVKNGTLSGEEKVKFFL